jgi:hypothetical protein
MTRRMLVAVPIILAGCNSSSPTSPAPISSLSPSGVPSSILLATCKPAGPDIVCTALTVASNAATFASQDVTTTAQWTATPGDVVRMVAPGHFRPIRTGEVIIEARAGDALRTLMPSRFLVTPGAEARRLAPLMVIVRDDTAAVSGALVEVVDGYRAGATCTTDAFGLCTIDPVVSTETFSIRAAKAGYKAGTATFRGVPDGLNPAALLVTLARE